MKTAIRQYIKLNLEIDDPEIIEMLIATYYDSLQGNVAALQEALRNGNASSAADVAHALKGASANIGAQEVYKVTLMMEKRLRAGNVDQETQQLLEKLVQLRNQYEQET